MPTNANNQVSLFFFLEHLHNWPQSSDELADAIILSEAKLLATTQFGAVIVGSATMVA
jgi:hypothetical protein